ncbi:hypothetical protein ABVT39_020570 [Epinephelus coioides]
MVVDSEAQALSVKLIDFGLAFPTSLAQQGELQQKTHYRAPEILLGLPFSEAIDIYFVFIKVFINLFMANLFIYLFIALPCSLNLSMVEVDERKECIDLLKAMLEMDPDERITPRQVLAHLFIKRGTLHHPSDAEASRGTPSTSSAYPGVILVQPAQTASDLVWGGGKERENKT